MPAFHADLLDRLKAYGLPVPPRHWMADDIDQALTAIDELAQKRHAFDFQIDGAVLKVNERALYATLGATAKSPRWAIAFKYEPERVETRLTSITIQVGRTGVLTPVAELEPVVLDGSTIRRATLHNAREIERKDIRSGDHVIIEKAGDVIPAVVRVLAEKRSGAAPPFTMPEDCPVCGERVTQREGEVATRCENLQCPAQLIRLLGHFASRGALDIEELGGVVADKLVERGLVTSPLDLFGLDLDSLAGLNLGTPQAPRIFGEKHAQRVLSALDRARRAPLADWLFALGIARIGKTVAFNIAAVHDDLEALVAARPLRDLLHLLDLQEAARRHNPRSRDNRGKSDAEKAELATTVETLQGQIATQGAAMVRLGLCRPRAGGGGETYVTRGVGPEAARGLIDFLDATPGQALVERMRGLGINPRGGGAGAPTASPVAGKTIVITGTFHALTRDEASGKLRALGANVSSSVSRKTDMLSAGDNAGSKLAKADSLDVAILDESALLELIGGDDPPPPPRAPSRDLDLFPDL